MNLEIIQTLVFPIVSIVSYFAWRKYQNKDYFWIMWVGIIGLLLDIVRYIATSSFNLTPNLSALMSAVSIAIWIVLIILLIKIGFWGTNKGKWGQPP